MAGVPTPAVPGGQQDTAPRDEGQPLSSGTWEPGDAMIQFDIHRAARGLTAYAIERRHSFKRHQSDRF